MGVWNHHSPLSKSESHPIQFGGDISINSESAITVNPNTDYPVPQPDPAVFLATPQSTRSGVQQTPTCSGFEEAVIPEKDISTTPGNPSSSHIEGITRSPATPGRRYSLRLRKSPWRLNLI